jgi:transglutaminase-like putative cysteine protease
VIYSVRHVTTFHYEPAVRESVMELRLQPRSDARQRCLKFHLDVDPSPNIMEYRDFMGNTVHHFNLAESHTKIKITSQALVEVDLEPAPRAAEAGSWADLDALIENEDHWEMLLPSQFAQSSELLRTLGKEFNCTRRDTPLEILLELNQAIYQTFAYVPNSTKVDSLIDEALQSRQGVCQDFAHIMIALARQLRIPCRYVSGYLFRGEHDKDRSVEGASHAWVEALVPGSGWIAFDPTNNCLGEGRHIKVALGRDYADVPPTRGVYRGGAHSELSVAVMVTPSNAPTPAEMAPSIIIRSRPAFTPTNTRSNHEQQQQQ